MARTVYQEKHGSRVNKYRTGKTYWYGMSEKDWASLMDKGSSLATLKTTDLAEASPEVREIGEAQEQWRRHQPHYSGDWFWSKHTGDTYFYQGLGREETAKREGSMLFDTAKQAKEQVSRVLGIFSKRKEEASLRQRAPGRAATMLTTKNKTQLTGY